MTVEHVEIERKYDVEEAFVLPDLSDVPGVGAVADPVEHVLEAAYYDTADLRLSRAAITLRRRTGGTDAGWHVKLPAVAGARRELHSPLGRAAKTPPKAVLAPVLGIVRSAPAAQVALLHTRRIVTELLDVEGRVLAEVADDHVTGTAVPAEPGQAAVVTAWREVEVELVTGAEELLSAVGAALRAAGAEPGRLPSKLTRVLADRLAAAGITRPEAGPTGITRPEAGITRPEAGITRPEAGVGPDTAADTEDQPDRTKKRKKSKKRKKTVAEARRERVDPSSAGELVRDALAAQLTALLDADLMVRTDSPDGVHQIRVACRRLRSILAAFRPVLAREQTDPLRDELQWVGTQLSGSRDAEVAVAHLRETMAAQPPELVLGPVAARLEQEDLRDEQAGGRDAHRALASPRYLNALDALDALIADPPLTGRATESAAPVVGEVLAHTTKRLRGAVATAQDGDDPVALHEVRKAAKRVRYTAEVAAPVLGAPVHDLISALKDVQDVLGDRQDTVVTREVCTRLGLQAFAAGENAWTYGRLHALEQARSEQAEREFWLRWPQLRRIVKTATT